MLICIASVEPQDKRGVFCLTTFAKQYAVSQADDDCRSYFFKKCLLLTEYYSDGKLRAYQLLTGIDAWLLLF